METFKITTDETLRETIQHGNNRYPFAYYPDNIWKFDFHRIDWHWHHELEFLYCEKYILPVISSSVPYQVFSPSNTFGKQVLQLLSQICTIQETKPDNELCTIQLLFQLWNILQKNMDWTS